MIDDAVAGRLAQGRILARGLPGAHGVNEY
jgi:hypothetical protein